MYEGLETVDLALWRSDAIVLFDWLMSVDLDQVPISHPAQKQALADLYARLEETDAAYGRSGTGVTLEEIEQAQSEVARNMGW